MRKIAILVLVALLSSTVISCASSQKMTKEEDSLAGYTLKSKKEQMHQQILQTRNRTVIAQP